MNSYLLSEDTLKQIRDALRTISYPGGRGEAVAALLADLPKVEPAATPSSTWKADGEPDPHAGKYDGERASLTLGQLTDDELANGAFLNYDRRLSARDLLFSNPGQYMPIVWMTAVKERIRWLSRKLEQALSSQRDNKGEELLNAHEQEYILSNPDALMMLMDYHDMQQNQADSMEAECWGDELRGEELRLIGAEVVKMDPEVFCDETRRRFLSPHPIRMERVERARAAVPAKQA